MEASATTYYRVTLTMDERELLGGLLDRGKVGALKRKHAAVLLKVDRGEGGPAWSDERTAEAVGVHSGTVHNIRERFVTGGLAAALDRQRQARRKAPVFDGAAEARLIALRCSAPPEGCCRWTLRLLADRAVELGIVGSTSHETVRQVLKRGRRPRTMCSAS